MVPGSTRVERGGILEKDQYVKGRGEKNKLEEKEERSMKAGT